MVPAVAEVIGVRDHARLGAEEEGRRQRLDMKKASRQTGSRCRVGHHQPWWCHAGSRRPRIIERQQVLIAVVCHDCLTTVSASPALSCVSRVHITLMTYLPC